MKRQHLLAAGIFIVALAFFYSDVVFFGRTFLMESTVSWTTFEGPYNYQGVQPGFVSEDAGAIAWYGEPYTKFIGDSIKKGDFPLWNPYIGLAGGPIFADGQIAPLEPIQLLFFLVPRRFWAYSVDLQLLIRFFLAGFFSYLFARRLKIGFAGSVTAGLLFMFQPYFVTYGNHPQIKTESLLPLVLYGFDRLTDFDDNRSVWLCTLFIGWAVIAGMPEAIFFTLFMGSLWYFYKIIFIKQQAGKKAFLRYIIATGLGILMAAVFLLPLFEVIMNSKSIHHFDSFFSIPLGEVLPVYRIPDLIFGDMFTFPYRIGYVAFFILVFSFLNIKEWSKYQKEILFFGSYASVFLLSIYDLPFANWLLGLPIINQVVVQKYVFPSVHLCTGLLAGIVIDQARRSSFSSQKLITALLLVCGFIVILPMAFAPPVEEYSNSYGLIMGLSLAVIGINFLFENRRHLLQLLLIPIILFEVFLGSMQFTRPSRVYPYQVPPFIEYLHKDTDPFRIFGFGRLLYPNISTAYRIRDIRWLTALFPERAYDFSSRFIESEEVQTIRYTGITFPKSMEMVNLLGVKYILTDLSFPDLHKQVARPIRLDEVYRREGVHIYQNGNAFPHAFIIYNVINVDNFQSALDQLQKSTFDPRKTAVVENLPAELSKMINKHEPLIPFTAGEAEAVNSGHLNVSVEADAPGLLVVSEQYYPGWVAYVDGVATPIYAVNGILRGVYIEKGQHVIEFKYRPRSVLIGALISIIVFLFVAGILIKNRRRNNIVV